MPNLEDAAYKAALRKEYHREYSHKHQTLRGKFEASFERFQAIEADESKDAYLSDNGSAAEKIRSFDETEEIRFRKAYDRARKKVMRRHPECLGTLNLIIKNGKEIQKSLCDIICQKLLRARKSKRHSHQAQSKKRVNT